jgi:polysaccharide deacetylase family protein (PEP-CTERM system associated)
MLNAISVDVEEYFHVEAFAGSIDPKSWPSFESRIGESIDRILHLFQSSGTCATFFVLGRVAERFPSIVRKIAEAGHEIGCHGFDHQRIHRQTPDQFRQDIRAVRRLLMSLVEKPVRCYRAPSFSITKNTLWALDVLAEEGFGIDSSIFPVKHDLYGIPGANRFAHWITTPGGKRIFEFPPSTIRLAGNNLGVAGGGYLRLEPYSFTRWAIRHINERELQPVMVYFHPWEIDPGQPRIAAPLRSRFRHYTNLSRMQKRVERLLKDFHFQTVSEACSRLRDYGEKEETPPAAKVEQA